MSTVQRSAEASWKGDVAHGHGLVTTGSEIIRKAKFGLNSRVKGNGKDTNPEELIAAAAASCFSMALSKTLTDEGALPTELVVRCDVGMEVGEGGPTIRELTLSVEGVVPSMDEDAFHEAVETTAENCPVLLVLSPGFEEVSLSSRLIPV